MSRDFSSRRALLLGLVKHTCQRLAYPLVPFPSHKPSPKSIIYIYIYIDMCTAYTQPFEGARRGDRFQVSSCSFSRERHAGRGARKARKVLESRASRFEWNCIIRDYGCFALRRKERSWKTRDHTSVIWPALSHSAGININKSLDRSPVTSRLSWFLPTT